MNKEHINFAVEFANLVRSTLGPRGMNKMVIDQGKILCMTNDGATIIGSMKGGHPIISLFKELAKSQEELIGDGTTTTVILAGQLLQNAMELMNKGIHPTCIINGYNIAKLNSFAFLNQVKEYTEVEKIIRTSFGTKLTDDIVDHLTRIILNIEKPLELKLLCMPNEDPLRSELFKGFVFQGFTINDLMKDDITGRIAVLDFPINWKMDKFTVTSADEMEKVQKMDAKFKKDIVDKLKILNVKWIFFTDTTPEFESYLNDAGITGVVVFNRDFIDNICKASGAIPCAGIDQITDKHIGSGQVRYVKQKSGVNGLIYVDGNFETLILRGNTEQFLNEMKRAVDDVCSLLRNELAVVVGAGAIEIELAKYIRSNSKKFGGKEQMAMDKFAESLEVIPTIIAENAGLDAINVLTALKNIHEKEKDYGVDVELGISNARDRGIFEPVLIKLSAINSATNIANAILKLDGILQGEMK